MKHRLNRKRIDTSNTQIIQEARDLEHEHQILESPIEDVAAHHPLVLEMMNRLAGATQMEAVNIGLALQQIVRGPSSLLANQNDPNVAQTIQRMRSRAAAQDAAAEAYEKNKEAFALDVIGQAEKIMPTGEKRDQIIARAMKEFQEARNNATAKQINKKLKLQYEIEHGAKETIAVTGQMINISQNGASTPVIVPEVIRIGSFVWRLAPGTHVVPSIVAQRYRSIVKSRAEKEERKQVLLKNPEYNEAERKFGQIDKKYGSGGDRLPLREV